MNLEELKEKQKRIVPGVGNKNQPQIAIVGEAPGKQEAQKGRPFVGSSGKLLQSLFFRAKLSWDRCYITNVVKERPPGNNIKKFVKLKNKYPKETEEYKKYVDYLKEELKEVQPNVVLAVGNVSLYALTGERGITKWRGSIMESTLIPGLKIIPTIHPAAAQRNYMYQYYIFNDLQKLNEEKEYSEIRRPELLYYTDPTFEKIMNYLENCKKADLVAFDIEVGGFKIGLSEVSCISFSKDKESAISIPFTRGGKPRWSVENELKIWNTIADILENPNIRKVAQNRFFDGHFLFRRYGIITKNCEDTMIAQAINRPDFPKGLDFINSMFTKIGYYKADGKEWFGGRGNEEQFWLYNAKDSMVLSLVWDDMEQELKEHGNWETYQAQNGIVESLIFMSEHGIKIDAEGLEQKNKETKKELEEIEELFYEMAGREINLRSHKQLKEYFYGDGEENLGLKPYKSRSTGKPTTNKRALRQMAKPIQRRPAVPEAKLLLRHRKLSKLKGTYYEMNYDDDNRVRSSMNPVGTRTGRLSSSENIFGTGTNLQNQPYAMKEFFLADEDYVAYEIDLAQAENRIVAYVAPEPKLIEAFENDIDIHSRTASYIFGKDESEISHKEGSAPQFGNGDQSERYWGKKANHAFNYGQSAKAFAQQMQISRGEANKIHRAYFNAYPGIHKYHNMIKQKLQKDRTLTNLFGRRYTFLDRWDYRLFNEAYAFIPQSTIADTINRWGLIPIYEEMDDVILLNQVHDSVVFEIPKSIPYIEHAKYIKKICDYLSQPLTWHGREFRIPCELKILPVNLMEGKEIEITDDLWTKEIAKTIMNEVQRQNG